MSLFGQSSGFGQPSAAGTGGNLFGNTNPTNTQQPAPGGAGGLFGNASSTPATGAQQPGQSGGLFGGLGSGTTAGTTGGGGLFGNTTAQQQQQQQQQPGGLFGNTNTGAGAQPAAPSGGLFGNTGASTTNAQPATGGLFGNTGTGASGGGLFGGANQAQTQAQPTTGGLFGSSTAGAGTQPATGGLFGNTTMGTQPAASGSLFSNTSGNTAGQGTTGGLFGNTANAGTQPTTGGLFGSTTNSTQPASGGGLFGNTATTNTQPTGGLFSSTANAQPTTGGLFGNAAPTNAQPQSGGLFGNTSSTSSNPLFGNKPPSSIFGGQSTTTPTAATGGSLFGGATSTQPQQQPATSGFFGQPKPAGTLFGPGPTAGLGSSVLGSSVLGTSALGGPSTTLGAPGVGSVLGRTLGPGNLSNQTDPQNQYLALMQRIEAIAQAWNSNSPDCRFQRYFYNLVDPNQVSLYGRPANATNEILWQKAVRENPDPSCLVPVVAVGFDDLQQRVDAQTQTASAHQEKLKELQARIQTLAKRHESSNVSRLQRAAALQAQLSQRLLRLTQHLHLLIPTLWSSSIRPEEEALRSSLEGIEEDIKAGRLRGKMNELWALIGAVNASKEQRESRREWAVVDEEGLQHITQILREQQAGLEYLTKILKKDKQDLAVIYGQGPQESEPSDNLYSSTATLRASHFR